MFVKVEGVIQRSKTVKGAEEGRQVTALKIPFFEKPNSNFQLKVAGVMVMLSSALQRPHADSKARDAKVETSVELQQEVANLITSLSSLLAFEILWSLLNLGGTPQ